MVLKCAHQFRLVMVCWLGLGRSVGFLIDVNPDVHIWSSKLCSSWTEHVEICWYMLEDRVRQGATESMQVHWNALLIDLGVVSLTIVESFQKRISPVTVTKADEVLWIHSRIASNNLIYACKGAHDGSPRGKHKPLQVSSESRLSAHKPQNCCRGWYYNLFIGSWICNLPSFTKFRAPNDLRRDVPVLFCRRETGGWIVYSRIQELRVHANRVRSFMTLL